MGSLSRKMHRANNRFRPLKTRQPELPKIPVTPGIFCDCYGTLFHYNFSKDETLVTYLNTQHALGTPVTLISTNPRQVFTAISDIGLHPDIVQSLTRKIAYHNALLEVLIDDDPVGLKAAKLYDPRSPDFRKMMKEYLGSNSATQAAPTTQP